MPGKALGNVVVLNLVFFFPAVIGAAAFAGWVLRILRSLPGAADEGGAGGAHVPPPQPEPGCGPRVAGRDDLARSA